MIDAIAMWQKAEGAIGKPRALERVAERLPGRLGWLLRAIDALDRGDASAVEALAGRCRGEGQPEIAMVLEVALADPATLNPSAVRREAKSQGAGRGMGLPYLDLLRLFAAQRSGGRTTKSAALRAIERQPGRVVLRAVSYTMSTTSDSNHYRRDVRRLSPRAEQVILVAHLLDNYPTDAVWFLEQNFDEVLLKLTSGRWPDLALGASGIESWLRGGDWDAAPESLRGLPEGTRRRLLTQILGELHRRISAGRIAGLVEPACAACSIASGIRGLGALRDLIHTLHQKLEWLDPQSPTPPELLGVLYSSCEDPAARAGLGEELLELEAIPPKLGGIALAHGASQPDLRQATAQVEMIFEELPPSALSPSVIKRAMEGVDPWRRAWFQLVRDLAREDAESALSALPELVAGAPVPELLSMALLRALSEIRPRRQRSRQVQRPVERFIAALSARGEAQGFDLETWGPLLLSGLGALPWPKPGLDAARAIAALPLEGLSPLRQSMVVAAAQRAGDEARVAALVRDLGRLLVRTRPVRAGDRMGVELIGCLSQARLDPSVLAPLDRYLLKRGRGALSKAIAGLSPPSPTVGLVRWWRRNQGELGAVPGSLRTLIQRDQFSEVDLPSDMPPGAGRLINWLIDAFCEDPDADLADQLGPILGSLGDFDALSFEDEPLWE